ncbi:MAG: long-chain fatty acid--CoA ligase [Burkholderiales bacterium]|nr:MAG: long-chain fatty acid--CoA ligase [Burkholderiales bacterium]
MNVADLLDAHAHRRAFAVAVLTESATVHFGLLDRLVWLQAGRFARLRPPTGAAIMLSFRDQLTHLVASLAAFRAGIAQISVPAGAPEALTRPLIERTSAALVACDDAQVAAGHGIPWVQLDLAELRSDRASVDPAARREAPDEPALYVPGSGTTGAPRIITYTARGFLASIARCMRVRPIARDERHLSLSSIDYYTPRRRTIACLGAGGAAVLLDAPSAALEACDRLAVDHLTMAVPQAWQLARVVPGEHAGGPRLPRLRSLEVGSAPVSESLRARLRAALSAETRIVYGANECGEISIATPEMQLLHPGCVGRACDGVELQVVDESDRELPPLNTGRVRVRAEGIFAGYLNEAEATAQVLRDRWYYPGDLGHLTPDGTLIFDGRSDDLMIFDGINIYPREIEAVLEEHHAVTEAAAFPVPSRLHHHLPVAAVQASSAVTEQELLRFCRERLGVRAPARIAIADELPRGPGGKVLKRRLAARFAAAQKDAGAASE